MAKETAKRPRITNPIHRSAEKKRSTMAMIKMRKIQVNGKDHPL